MPIERQLLHLQNLNTRIKNKVGLQGYEGVFQVKQYHALFPKDFIEEALKEAPGGVHIALEGRTEDEVPLVALGYRYSRKTVLHFILTKNVGSSKPGTPYQMICTDLFSNICTRYVDHPQVISIFLLVPIPSIPTISYAKTT